MIAPFTASSAVRTSAAPDRADPMYSVSVKNFTFQGMPATVQANQPFEVTFINDEAFPILHEFVVLKLPPGDTAQDVVERRQEEGPEAEDDWAHVADSGAPLPVWRQCRGPHATLKPGN